MKRWRYFFLVLVCVCCTLFFRSGICSEGIEKMVFSILPAGRADYLDYGIVEFDGRQLRKIIFKVRVLGFSDTETIYADPQSFLPVRVERDISGWMKKEEIVEEYNQEKFILEITKSARGRAEQKRVIKQDGPMHNGILLPLFVRNLAGLEQGMSFLVRFPLRKFTMTVAAVEDIRVPAGSFSALHLTSEPQVTDIWLRNDESRVPLKVRSARYSMVLREYIL